MLEARPDSTDNATVRGGARIVDSAAFEAALVQRCAALAQGTAGFTVLLLRLTRADRRVALLKPAAADRALGELLARIAGALHDDDLVAACSRDEVAILLARVAQEGVARLAADRILRALAGAADRVRPCIGAAIAPASGRCVADLLTALDAACEAAAGAQPRLAFAGAAGAERNDDAALLPALQRALADNALTVVYQPQYDLARGTWPAVEALIRWPRPAGAPEVSAARAVELAERHGLIDDLTGFVLNTALRQAAALARAGLALDVAINLSPSMLDDAALPERVAQALAVWDLPPARLVLEVTENAVLRDGAAPLEVLRRLARLGARLSIDDFGTGHSSLARLREMPLAELKIDRLFIANMTHRREDLQIVRSVIDLAHNFDLRAVAEGVEDAVTFDRLRALGCDAVQGYYCARPMSLAELQDWWPHRPRYGHHAQ
jgi:EAL domain-containing protein (putative c-di-GMP-specific phosphodiesterase class I)/GGDEF domain-containing protein